MANLSPQSIIDSHCHLDFPVFDDDRSLILKNCQANKIDAIIVPGVCHKDWQHLLTVCHQQAMLFPALGLHPCFTEHHNNEDLDRLDKLCASESLIAIGEIGLDFWIKDSDKDAQRHYFSEQLQIAAQYQLPVLIHARKSHDEVIKYLKHNALSSRGIIHAYSGSYEQAREYLKLGFKLGFGGAFTYPKATKLRSLLAKLPIDAWVLETDAPDMSPVKHHGERNSPQYLTEIVQEFIQLLKVRAKARTKLKAEENYEDEQIIKQLQQNTLAVLPLVQSSLLSDK